MKLVIEQKPTANNAYRNQLGFTYQLDDGEVRRCAKGSVMAQLIRVLVRVAEIGEHNDGFEASVDPTQRQDWTT